MTFAGQNEGETPHSVEAEQQLLGAILLSPPTIGRVVQSGGADLFHDPVHRRLFEACAAKNATGDLVSPVTMAAAMDGDPGLADLGGRAYVVRLAGAAIATSAVAGYIKMLADLRYKRRIAAALSDAQGAIARGDEPADRIAAKLEAALISLGIDSGPANPVSMLKATTMAVEQAHAAYSGEAAGFVKSGIFSLDKIVGGFHPGELILLGGRPSMGKTAVAMSLALNAARAGNGVAFASLEMNPEALATRALSEATAQIGRGVAYSQIRRGDFSEDDGRTLMSVAKEVSELPITFLPRQFSDIGALVAGARQIQRSMGDSLRLMIVDYAQLLRSQGRNRYDQITEVSLALKALAGQLNVPVVALSQLSRAVEQRDDKRPMMSDLRESGQLEQDADTVLFCYREEYYHDRDRPGPDAPIEDQSEWQVTADAIRNKLEIIVAKQRQGEIGTAHVRCNPALNLIWED